MKQGIIFILLLGLGFSQTEVSQKAIDFTFEIFPNSFEKANNSVSFLTKSFKVMPAGINSFT